MERLLKSNSIYSIVLILFFSLLLLQCSNKRNYSTLRPLIIGDVVQKKGYIIFDSYKGRAYLSNENIIDINLLNCKRLKKIINKSDVILIRKGLENYKDSEFLTLSLCYKKDDALIIKMNELLFGRYAIIKISDFTMYKVNQNFNDSKNRFVICSGDW